MFTLSYIVSVYLIFINIALIFIKKNIKYFVFLTLALMWTLFWGSTENADSENYMLLYETVAKTGEGFFASEVGFVSLIKLATFFDLSYSQFLMIVSFVGLFLIYLTVNRYTKKHMYVWSLYFIYPFLLDIVQVRHFLAMSIVVYSVKYLEKGSSLKYVLGILVAFTIQFSSIIFLPFVFFYQMRLRNMWIVVGAVTVAGFFIVNTPYIKDMIGLIVNVEKVNSYFENRARLGYLLQWAIQIVFMITVFLIYRNLAMRNINEKIVEITYKINIYIMMMFPIYMINLNSSRIFRMTLILNYIVFAIGFSKLNNNTKYILFIYILFLIIGLHISQIVSLSENLVLYPIFQKNIFLN